MLKAELHGKTSEDASAAERREDVLTSSVFGLLDYVECGPILADYFKEAVNLGGRHWECSIAPRVCRMAFWPWLDGQHGKNGCEPDVLVAIGGGNAAWTLILIEAKYRSGKSGGPTSEGEATVEEPGRTHDQLAREWEALQVCDIEKHLGLGPGDRILDRSLVYLTADHVLPRRDIEESVSELQEHGHVGARSSVFWISWQKLPPVLARHPSTIPERMRNDCLSMLERRGLRAFSGFRVHFPIDVRRVVFWDVPERSQRATGIAAWFRLKSSTVVGPGRWWQPRSWNWDCRISRGTLCPDRKIMDFRRST